MCGAEGRFGPQLLRPLLLKYICWSRPAVTCHRYKGHHRTQVTVCLLYLQIERNRLLQSEWSHYQRTYTLRGVRRSFFASEHPRSSTVKQTNKQTKRCSILRENWSQWGRSKMQKTTTSTIKWLHEAQQGSSKTSKDPTLRKAPDFFFKNSVKHIFSNHLENSLLKETWVIPVELFGTVLFYNLVIYLF